MSSALVTFRVEQFRRHREACGLIALSWGLVMRAYVAITGALFLLLTLVHLWRVYEEGSGLARQPFFVTATLVSAALCVWAWRLLRERGVS
jgi:hypothetical protein